MPELKPVSIRRLALLLGGLAMFGPFSIDTIFPAFPEIGAQLGADKLAMQQTISVYLLAYALTSVVHGPLSDAIGRRKVILGGLAVFTVASAGCALAMDLPTLLFWRAVQGLSAGVGLIVGRALIRDFPETYAYNAMKEYTVGSITQHNRNTLLWRDGSIDGIKTGHHSQAGYCLAASAKRDDTRLIAVVMGTASEKVRAAYLGTEH